MFLKTLTTTCSCLFTHCSHLLSTVLKQLTNCFCMYMLRRVCQCKNFSIYFCNAHTKMKQKGEKNNHQQWFKCKHCPLAKSSSSPPQQVLHEPDKSKQQRMTSGILKRSNLQRLMLMQSALQMLLPSLSLHPFYCATE